SWWQPPAQTDHHGTTRGSPRGEAGRGDWICSQRHRSWKHTPRHDTLSIRLTRAHSRLAVSGNFWTSLAPVSQKMIGKHNGNHRLPHGRKARQKARIVTTLGSDRRFGAISCHRILFARK